MPETKATLSHTEKMRQQFLKMVQVFRQFSPEDYSLSVFDKELIQRVSIISPEEIDTMRRSALLIHTEKLKRLYLNNPNLPEELLEHLRVFVEEMEAIQLQEEEVQHMGSKGDLVVETVKSATNYTTKNRVLKHHLHGKKQLSQVKCYRNQKVCDKKYRKKVRQKCLAFLFCVTICLVER